MKRQAKFEKKRNIYKCIAFKILRNFFDYHFAFLMKKFYGIFFFVYNVVFDI